MSFLTDASLVFIPSGYKEDKAYSIKPTDGSGDLTFARASDGTRVNSDGLIERVPYNLLQQSNTFSNSVWNKSNTTVTSGQSGYDGLSNAWNLIPNTTNTNSHRMYIDYSSGGGVFTASIYAKANGYNFLKLNNYSASVVFDISSGTIVSESGSPIESHIESVGNGWHKISVTKDSLLGNLRTQIFVQIDAANTSFSGDGTSGVLIQDAQLNEGTLKPYFPTTNRQDVPRLDYSNGCPCLLLEPQRTNLLTYSEQFNLWTEVNSPTITTNIATAPNGIATADGIQDTTGGSFKRVSYSQSVSANSTYTGSIYIKKETSQTNYGGLVLDFTGGTRNVFYVIFDAVNGVANNSTSSTSSCTISVSSFNSDWWRLIVTATDSGSNTSLAYQYFATIATSATGGIGIGAGSVRTLWGAQLEAGSYPTSYIPTTSASVTRVADAASKTGISDLIGQSEGTIFLDFVWYNSTASAADYPIMVYGSTYADFVGLNTNTNNNQMLVYSGGSSVASISGGSFVVGERYKIAMAYKANDFVYYINGAQKGTDTNGAVPVGLANIRTQTPYGSKSTGQKTEQMLFFKTRLTNDQLEYLTGNSYSTYATMASQLNYTIQ